MSRQKQNIPHRSGPLRGRPRPADTEVPAGPGDAGASDKPQLLKNRADAKLSDVDRVIINVLWGVALVMLLIAVS